MDENTLLNLRKFLSPEIVYGNGALELCGRHASNLGATKVLIVTDPGVKAAGWAALAEKSLADSNIEYVTFDSLSPNPKDKEVMSGADLFRKEECDLIVSVGGGSPMDCAKGIGAVVGNSGHILEYEGVDQIPHPGPPLIFIPTTAGTSADVSQFAIITDTRRKVKIAIISKMVIPEISLVDPSTTMTMPKDLTAATGMDALCHAFEAYVSTASSPLTDMSAIKAVQIVSDWLLTAYHEPRNMEARSQMMTASLMAGLAFSNASLGLVHAMAHSLGGALDLAHGECNAILLEKVVQYNYDAEPEKYNQLAVAMGIDVDQLDPGVRAKALCDTIGELRKNLGITRNLSDMGVRLSDLGTLASFAAQDACIATNPKPAEPEDIENIYGQALD